MLLNAPVVANLWTTDVGRAKAFYTEKLGLKPLKTPMEEIAMFEAGDGTRVVVQLGESNPSGHTVAVFAVKDLAGTIAELASRGVAMESYDLPNMKTDDRGIVTIEGFACSWFKDPDGNLLSLTDGI
jgi:predicted enzyme related to lactoylglutathione lyase